MKNLLNIIIPLYNRTDETLELIESIKKSEYKNYNITVVDDCSTKISNLFCKSLADDKIPLIRHDVRKGPASARNTGAKSTNGDILIFIDSDVLIYPDTLKKVVTAFNNNPSYAAIIPIPGIENKFQDIYSTHFVFRIHFNYNTLPDFIKHTYGSFTAIKRETFNKVGGYNEKLLTAGIEDSELGLDIYKTDGKIYIDKLNSIIHNKKINFIGILINDFNRTVDRILYLLRRNQLTNVVSDKRFISNPSFQMLSALLSPLIAFFAFFSLINAVYFIFLLLTLIIFAIINLGYLGFVNKHKGPIFSIKIYLLLVIDMLF